METRDALPQVRRYTAAWIVAILAASLVGVVVGTIVFSSRKPSQTMRFSSVLPSGDSFGGSDGRPGIAVSPDGTYIAYVATHDGVSQMFLRPTGEWDGRPLAGTGDAHTPFFSPDGKWLGAVAGDKLLKFPVGGGAPAIVSRIPFKVYGACWAVDGWIYLGTESPLGLVKVPAAGGTPHGATQLDDDHGETDHRFPEVLPGAKWMLFAARKAGHSFDEADIEAVSLKNGDVRTILKGGTNPRYIANGHLVFLRAGVLMAARFDPVKVQLQGEPVPVGHDVIENPTFGAGQYGVSAEGTLVYLPGGVTFGERELVSVDRNGATRILTARKQPYEDLALSPDGKLIATTIGGPATDIWIHDLARGTETPFTSGGEHRSPAWSADGKHILYSGYTGKEDAQWVIFRKPADGSAAEKQLAVSETPMWPWFASPDGHTLLYEESGRSGNYSGWKLPLEGPPIPGHLAPRDFDQEWVQISPDGRWLAYNSDDSGRQEVYVAPFPALDSNVKVSAAGGRYPQWSPNGRELYYLENDAADNQPVSRRMKLMAVPLETSPQLKAGTPHMLFAGPFIAARRDYAVTPDGKGFIFIRESQPGSGPGEMKVVLGWDNELKRRLPVN